MKGSFLFLGSGASTGVPVIGCGCSTCQSKNPKDKRLRPAGLIEVDGKRLLLDVGPDFRYQALKYNIKQLDGLLLTHVHFDHIAGVDELRVYYFHSKKPLPCLLSAESLDELKCRYHYLFQPIGEVATMSAQLEFQMLTEEAGRSSFQGIDLGFCSYFQSKMKVSGFIIGNFAYISDIRDYEESIFAELKGVKYLVVSALREEVSPVHFNIEEAIEFAKKIGAEETYFTHISHNIEHEKIEKKLPKGVYLGYDGLKIEFDYKG